MMIFRILGFLSFDKQLSFLSEANQEATVVQIQVSFVLQFLSSL